MPVPKLYPEEVAAKFRSGTLEGITSVLLENETRAAFIRKAVEDEIVRRKRAAETAQATGEDGSALPAASEPSNAGETDAKRTSPPTVPGGASF